MTDIAYHFTGDKLRDGRPIPPIGEWLTHDGPCEMCRSGLHASRHPFDALQYAPGDTLHRVEVDEIVHEQGDKLVCRRRRILASIDATELLRELARWCALQVSDLSDAPEVMRRYLETGDESLRIAARDARAAAWDAWDAAWDARDTATGAAWDAASAVARGAAARDAQRQKFAEMVDAAFERVMNKTNRELLPRLCPRCGTLAVLFADPEVNSPHGLGLQCGRRCGWELTMMDLAEKAEERRLEAAKKGSRED